MITVRKRDKKTKKLRPVFIHGSEDEKGNFTEAQVSSQLLEDMRNVMESMVRETRRMRKFLEEAVKLARGEKP